MTTEPTRPWDALLTDLDRQARAAAGRRSRRTIGPRTALLVVDVTYDFTGDQGDDLLTSIRKFRAACGPAAWEALPRIRELLDLAHELRVPVIYTKPPERDDPLTGRNWDHEEGNDRRTPESRARGSKIPPEIAPTERDLVLEKIAPSGFFGTPLATKLIELGVDHVIVAGVSTSGCVRATVIDAHSYGFGVTVVEDCCFDRTDVSHRVNLFDMDAKYATVSPLREVAATLRSVTRS